MGKVSVAILKNEDPYDHLRWVKACDNFAEKIHYEVIDLISNSWLDVLQTRSFDCLLAKPGAKTSIYRSAYQERIEILVFDLKYNVFPSLPELRIYENKRYLSYWLKAHNIPHPKTSVSYVKNEALDYLADWQFPCVGKMNIGASGDGVTILDSSEQAREYIEIAFSSGIKNKTGPKLNQKNLIANKFKKLLHPKQLINRIKAYSQIARDAQIGFVILQEYIPHDYEWRIVRIGDSFFGHKKIKSGTKASGSLVKGYEDPPQALLDFVKRITDKHGFYSQAVDVFIDKDGQYLVNEMQCIFGQSDPFQMKVDGRIGRYIMKNKNWVFEEGDFNTNESFDLRAAHVVQKYGDGQWRE